MVKNRSIYGIGAQLSNGRKLKLEEYEGKVVLVVNTASKCGYTPQYEGLQELYSKHKDKGLVILAFPCDQFANQEPGSNEEIQEFCKLNYGVSFPIFMKTKVNGPGTHPLFVMLKRSLSGLFGGTVKWNFTKFLVDRSGRPVKRYAPNVEPKDIEDEIVALLA